MKKLRIAFPLLRTRMALLLALMLLIVAVPTFAATCSSCTVDFECFPDPNSGTRCFVDLTTGACIEKNVFCINSPVALASDYAVASVDVRQPRQQSRETVATSQTADLHVAQK